MIKTISENINLDEYLNNLFCSKKITYLLKQEKRIKINNKIVINNIQLNKNDIISIDLLKDEETNVIPTKSQLDILYEDDYLLIINKPIGILIHDDNLQNTLDNYVAYYYKITNQKHNIYHIHRLDKNTSGCILYCKQPYLTAVLNNMLETKKIQRTYLALAEGEIKKQLIINKPIGNDRHQNNHYIISKTGKQAITIVQPLKRIDDNTLIKCILKTGRTHQIRVHLSSINHPLIGDILYGGKKADRLMLHSYNIKFIHPVTEKIIDISCPIKF